MTATRGEVVAKMDDMPLGREPELLSPSRDQTVLLDVVGRKVTIHKGEGTLGMVILPDDETRGTRVFNVVPDSPAANATIGRLERGDVILRVGEQDMLDATYDDVVLAIHASKDDVELVVCEAAEIDMVPKGTPLRISASAVSLSNNNANGVNDGNNSNNGNRTAGGQGPASISRSLPASASASSSPVVAVAGAGAAVPGGVELYKDMVTVPAPSPLPFPHQQQHGEQMPQVAEGEDGGDRAGAGASVAEDNDEDEDEPCEPKMLTFRADLNSSGASSNAVVVDSDDSFDGTSNVDVDEGREREREKEREKAREKDREQKTAEAALPLPVDALELQEAGEGGGGGGGRAKAKAGEPAEQDADADADGSGADGSDGGMASLFTVSNALVGFGVVAAVVAYIVMQPKSRRMKALFR